MSADLRQAGDTATARCTRCSFENPQDVSACGCCGAPVDVTCPACGTVNPGRFRFCGGCGAPLGSEPAHERPAAPAATPERRQLTVMFCDLVGSTQLSLSLDPEELREVLRAYQAVCARAIERFGGHIAQYLGDGVLVYFGYPVAQENEAELAVRAGLRVVREMDRLADRLRAKTGAGLAVRIGIHTGLAVVDSVGGGARRENLALGGTPNIAARLQTVAAPGTVVISAATHRLVGRGFVCEDLGAPKLRGVTGIGSAFRVDAERTVPRGTPGTPLFGREAELALLAERWRTVTTGRGRAVIIRGDPGIGKSHLVDEFLSRSRTTTHVVIECRCLPWYQSTAFHPLIDYIQRELGPAVNQEAEKAGDALRAMLDRDGLPAGAFPALAALLDLAPGAEPVNGATPESMRAETRTWLIRLVLQASKNCPLVFLMEDLHWADPSTLDLLEGLVDGIRHERVMALFTSRPGAEPPWHAHDQAEIVDLARLARTEAERIVAAVAGKPMPGEVVDRIVDRTDGVPLFIQELSRMVVQSGLLEETADRFELHGPLPPLAIPATLKDSLEARLDRLAAVKEIAQLGAVLGREFDYRTLAAAARLNDTVLRNALRQLSDAQLIEEEGTPPDSSYSFRHALIQEAAYESLLHSTRQRHHLRVARVLEEQFPDVAESEPETLAHHYTAAGLPSPAAQYWLRAARRAMKAWANVEAAVHLRRGIELLDGIGEPDDRKRLELEMQAALGTALTATEGYASQAVREAYSRARSLGHELDDTTRLPPVVTGLFAHHLVRLELTAASERADELSALAARTGDDEVGLLADAANGSVRLTMGDLSRARHHLERTIRSYDPERHASLLLSFGHDIGVIGHAYLSLLHWFEGYAIQSRESGETAVALARRIRHPHTLALALAFHGGQQYLRGEYDEAARTAEELLSHARQWRFAHWEGDALLLQASVLAERGQTVAAAERLDHVIELARSRGRSAYLRHDLRLPHALHAIGRETEAKAVAEEVVANTHAADAFTCDADYFNLMALILVNEPGAEAEAEHWLRRSLEASKQRTARFPELRAATRLAELLGRRGSTDEALELLEPIYARFTEGHELADLRDAARVLSGLRRQVNRSGP